ncbi:MAG: vWA domain-containing protein [Pseudomonadota bacterium]
MKRANVIVGFLALAGMVGFFAFEELSQTTRAWVPPAPVTPNWAAIAAWPDRTSDSVQAVPDPNRRITAIVLDDSGSMGGQMEPAKTAVIQALDAMAGTDRVAVVALNAGVIQPFTTVDEARVTLPSVLRPIRSDGGTPLTRSVQRAQTLLEEEAAAVRGFGTFRLIVTTDGQADDGAALDAAIERVAATTPIQVTTIGIGISGSHVLRRNDIGSFVDVANVAALAEALQAAVAENTAFSAITEFDGTEG